jgi:hypothetical protein
VGCAEALPALDAFARRHGADALTVVAINIDTERAKAERFLAERIPQPAMVLAADPGGRWLARFGADGMPAIYAIDRAGVVRLAESGYAPARVAELERRIEALLGADAVSK